jgi:hypothetical protein
MQNLSGDYNYSLPRSGTAKKRASEQLDKLLTLPQPDPKTRFVASSWKAIGQKTMVGSFDLELPSGMIIRNCVLHEHQTGRRWVAYPAQSYKKADGTVAYLNVIDFCSRELRDAFQLSALTAITDLLARMEGSGA